VSEKGVDQLREPPVRGIESVDGSLVVSLAGELDLYNAHEVRDALAGAAEQKPERIVVDLSQVEFIDSTALGVLIEARTQLENRRAFLLAAPNLETRRALEISGLDRHFGIHDSVDDARAAKL
jgi:anti-sigma B factor antagonist